MLNQLSTQVYITSISILLTLTFSSPAIADQQSKMVIENTNLAFKQCMEDSPTVEVIRKCDNANACWAKWLHQYELAKNHQLACIKRHGGTSYSYHYPVNSQPNTLAQQ